MAVTTAEWLKCKQVAPPNEKGFVRVRITKEILGLEMTPEWTTEMGFCGMGYKDSEWWPSGIHRWDGYRRYFIGDYEWRPAIDADQDGVIWHGLELLPCPFTGLAPKIDYLGKWIGAPPDQAKWLSIKSHLVKSLGWESATKMRDAWNMRATPLLKRGAA